MVFIHNVVIKDCLYDINILIKLAIHIILCENENCVVVSSNNNQIKPLLN